MITINERFFNSLDIFLSEKNCNDVNRDTYLVHNIEDTINKITVSIVFLREWHTDINDDEYGLIAIPNTGAVVTVPGYWISVPKELAFTYLKGIVSQFYSEYVSDWFSDQDINSSTNNTSAWPNYTGPSTSNPCPGIIGTNI